MRRDFSFYQHGSESQEQGNFIGEKNNGADMHMGLIPTLHNPSEDSESIDENDSRSAFEKQSEIIQYLKKLSSEKMATRADIERDLSIDLSNDPQLVDMIKRNPKIYCETSKNGTESYRYAAKFQIRNKKELLVTIDRVENGIALSEIAHCYEGIENDCNELIIAGKIIACKNKELKTYILFPRQCRNGQAFYSTLSGMVKANPGQTMIRSTCDLTKEIRRGEAIGILFTQASSSKPQPTSVPPNYKGPSISDKVPIKMENGRVDVDPSTINPLDMLWYRISTTSRTPNGLKGRSKFPSSVTSETPKSLTEQKASYYDPFNAEIVPLDGEYDGDTRYEGPAIKHGCTNDVKDCWERTRDRLQAFLHDDKKLENYLLEANLISVSTDNHQQNNKIIYKTRGRFGRKLKIRPPGEVKRRRNMPNGLLARNNFNIHLQGTLTERIIRETGEKADSIDRH